MENEENNKLDNDMGCLFKLSPEIKAKIENYQNNPKNYFTNLFNYISEIKTSNPILNHNLDKINSKILSINPNDSSTQDIYKCLSCILGSFMGDSMGSYMEFNKPNADNCSLIYQGMNNFSSPPGSVTDDSEMAMSIAFSLMDNPDITSINQDILFFYYGLWLKSDPCDLGKSVKTSLSYFNKNNHFITSNNVFSQFRSKIASQNMGTKSNGFAMRLATFSVWYYYMRKKYANNLKESNNQKLLETYLDIKSQVKLDAEITHPNPENFAAGAIFAFMALLGIQGFKPNEIINKLKDLLSNAYFNNNKDENNVKSLIMKFFSIVSSPQFSYAKFAAESDTPFYGNSMRILLLTLVKFDQIVQNCNNVTKFRKIMNSICNIGGDTDTNACIVGMVIGPIFGFKEFGMQDLKTLLGVVPETRTIYTTSLMYFFVKYLDLASKYPNLNKKYKDKVRFNTYALFETFINSDMEILNDF